MKRLVGVAVTALLSVSVCFTAFGAVSTNASPWAVPHMEQAYSLQLITAPLLQQAQDTMTRVEFSEIAVAFYEKVTGTTAPMPKENPFSDCDEPAALKAYGLDIIAGVEPGTFAPENPLTREQMAIMLVRTLEKVGVDMSLYAKKNPFTDTKNNSATTVSYIDKAYGAGLISGYQNGTFAPKNTLKVQEAVTAFLSAYTFYEGVQSGTSVPKGDAVMAKTVTINGKELTLGQTIEEVQATFGAPTRIDETVYGLDRYIYAGDGYFWVTFENDAAFNQEVFVNMDLVPCPVCGHLCSRDALTCPKCGKPLAKKNKVIAAILALLFGGLGLHKFYLGKILWGVIYLLFCWTGIPSIVGLVEGIIYLFTSDEDFNTALDGTLDLDDLNISTYKADKEMILKAIIDLEEFNNSQYLK